MERNEQDIFDELVRQKLTGYTEPPEPAWIKNIHAKKNRVINLYHLYRLMLITALAGAGIFSSIYYFVPQQSASNNNPLNNGITQTELTISEQQQASAYTSFAGTGNANDNASSTQSQQLSNTFKINQTPATIYTVPAQNNTSRSSKTSHFSNKAQGNGTSASENDHTGDPGKITNKSDHAITEQPAEKRLSESDNKTPAIPSAKDSVSLNTDKQQSEDNSESKNTETTGKCNAAFEYFTSYNGEISFTNTSEVSAGADMTWSFGDGDRSVHNEPSHSFAKTGTYEVTLYVKDTKLKCEDSYTKTITFRNPDDKNIPVSISGILFAGGAVVKDGFVELYMFNDEKGGYENVSTVKTSHTGEFEAPIEKGKRYVLKGNPTGEHPDYTATFWGNTTEIESASDVMAMLSEDKDLLGYNIDLRMGERNVVNEEITTGSPFASNEQNVYLVDANNNIISVATVDANGNFNFGDVAPGDYTVVNPATGASSSKTIGSAGKGNGNINGNSPGNSSGGSVGEKVTVFPNPANTVVNFGVNSLQSENVTIVIMNAGGVELSRETKTFTAGFNQTQYDLSAYPPGIYYVLIFKGNQQVLTNRLVKLSADNTK